MVTEEHKQKLNNMKFDVDARTFETRLQFIHDIFEHKYDNIDILAKCIQYKLCVSYDVYLERLESSLNYLQVQNSTSVLRRL